MEFFRFDEKIKRMDEAVMRLVREQFEKIEKITEYNQQKVQMYF